MAPNWTPINNPNPPARHDDTYEPIDFDLPAPAPKRKRQTRKTSPKKRVAKSPPPPNFKASKPVTQPTKKVAKKPPANRRLLEEPEPEPPAKTKTYSKNALEAFKYKGPQVRSTGHGQISPLPSAKRKPTKEQTPKDSPKKQRKIRVDTEEDYFKDLSSQDLIELEKATRKLTTEEPTSEAQRNSESPQKKRPSTARTRTTTTDYFADDLEDYSLFGLEDLAEDQLYHGGEHEVTNGILPAVPADTPQADRANDSHVALGSTNTARTRTGFASPIRGTTYEDLELPDLDLHPQLRSYIRNSSPPYVPNASDNPNRDYRVEAYFPGHGSIYTKSTAPDEYDALVSEAQSWNNTSDTLVTSTSHPSSEFDPYPFNPPTTVDKAALFKPQSSFTSVSSMDIFTFTDPSDPTSGTKDGKRKRRSKALLTEICTPKIVDGAIHIQCTANSSPKPDISEYVTKKPKYIDYRPKAVDTDSDAGEMLRNFLNPHEAEEKAKAMEEKRKEALRFKPFVRPPFPALLKDRSPVEGLSGKEAVRVCFRIGEVVRVINGVGMEGGKPYDGYIELYGKPHALLLPLHR
ncbi:hypothetical protein BJ508DRAFT_112049 [Ascobolus immersus RN42]|uniref:Uncharacterized protein n=1 Tax=Ascobolus immersus RN42 TaxID=1160509 RepID=A0A3N4IIF1_ASCIM|nr:hypothetical protein BJ508DRAFT_112049 [Ascobolus immersus RN42]